MPDLVQRMDHPFAFASMLVLYVGTTLIDGLPMFHEKAQRRLLFVLSSVFAILLIAYFPAAFVVYLISMNLWSIGERVAAPKLLRSPEASRPATV